MPATEFAYHVKTPQIGDMARLSRRRLLDTGVAACLLDGLTDKEAALAMGVPTTAIKHTIEVLMRAHGARNRVHLAVMLARMDG